MKLQRTEWQRRTNDKPCEPAVFVRRLPRVPRRAARGFTLIETALATIIVGVGVLAMVAAQQAFHRQNRWSTLSTTATRLANEIRELTLNLPQHDPVTGTAIWGPEGNEPNFTRFDDVDDFDGTSGNGIIFSADDGSGPINARREIIQNMPGWSQTVTVHNVDPFNITAVRPDNSSAMLRVEVVVKYHQPNQTEADAIEMARVWWIHPK
jgi:type II secretory pathway pseudopilin PulG